LELSAPWRQRLLLLIDEKFSIETSGVLKAAILGNRYELSRGTAERFREGGTFHVLVISVGTEAGTEVRTQTKTALHPQLLQIVCAAHHGA
jgi:hypothetical protein